MRQTRKRRPDTGLEQLIAVQQNSIEPIAAVRRSLGEEFRFHFDLERCMTGWVRFPPFVVLTLLLGTANAVAQSAGADEAITSHGAAIQTVGLTPVQKSAVYNAIVRLRVHASSTQIEAAVGASVSRSVPLAQLPDQTGLVDAKFLRYAMVADDVVVVDPIRMLVVDVIHGNIGP
jgi:hypothetical protein